MQLRSSPSSPFGRKVKMATYIFGFDTQVTPVLTDTLDHNDSICDINPLGKIPALEDGGAIYYDSRVIMEYLCLLYTSPSPRDVEESRMPSSA